MVVKEDLGYLSVDNRDQRVSGNIDLSEFHSDNSETETEATLTVENIYTEIGGFSTFQYLSTFLILSLDISSAMLAISPVLTTSAKVDFYCSKENDSISELIPSDSLCNTTCDGQIVSKQPYTSIIQEWNLICDKSWIADTIISIMAAGSAIGSIFIAHISDKYGRKTAFFFICISLPIVSICASHCKDIYSYGFFIFIMGLCVGGCDVASMTYMMEFLIPSWRVICGCVDLWPVGVMLLALAGYLFPYWRTLTWICVLPNILLLFSFPFLPESPRWLLTQNRTKEAQASLDRIAFWNGKPCVDESIVLQLQEQLSKEQTHGGKSFLTLWRNLVHATILYRLLIVCFAWFANALTHKGITLNMKNMSGDPYLNIFLLGALDQIAELLGALINRRFGRKLPFITLMGISVGFIVVVAGIILSSPSAATMGGLGSLILILCLIGRFFNECSYAIMAGFVGESFPTVIRSSCLSIGLFMSSLSGVFAPQVVYFGSVWTPGPYIIFCGFGILSCIFSMKLPETKGIPLQDVVK